MNKPKWLYRLESKTPENGLWYNLNNNLVWGIGKIENCLTKDLPMDYDARYHKDGRNWFSSCSKKEDLLHWYSLQNALDLIKKLLQKKMSRRIITIIAAVIVTPFEILLLGNKADLTDV